MTVTLDALPVPRMLGPDLVVAPPDGGSGAWAGAPSAVCVDGQFFLAYRLRRPIGHGRGYANVVARSTDGVAFRAVAEVGKDRFGAASLERPALVVTPQGRWRLYVSVATPGSKHWRVDLLEADEPAALAHAPARTVLPGDDRFGVKDPVVRYDAGRWHLWASVHPLESDEHADRMSTWYATSPDGVEWTWVGEVLAGRAGHWDARGVRISTVLTGGDRLVAAYDGRATAGENWEERTGWAFGSRGLDDLFSPLVAGSDQPLTSPHPPGGLRYLDALPLGGDRYRLYYEMTRADGAHELRTEEVTASW
ncbi:hypothetical protein [Rugosimonospora africana]|uniref:Glycosyl hydrolases family 43 n=1 Tax=Rugosimonospora africana TaxID=556532 RepID=A0A8J3VV13_9ACTN|nr:hypothetical protein [Rugosimonospora africana]GIH20157.1 hypothetical protein Raf01_83290 [Rugosimonospora africana]